MRLCYNIEINKCIPEERFTVAYAFFDAPPRLLIVVGHYGAGKTNVALNLACQLQAAGREVTLIDLDIVNPYFRAADAADMLTSVGIQVINPPFANSNVDIPVLGAEIQRVFPLLETNPRATVIFDVGGDNGSVALGRYRADIERIGYTMLCVENAYRPLTDTAEAMCENLREIEAYARLRCTAIVNNSNLAGQTTTEDIAAAFPIMEEFSRIAALPLVCTTVCEPISAEAVSCLPTPLWQIRNYTRQLF